MSKQLLNFGILFLLVAGCKFSAFNQDSAQNGNTSNTVVTTTNPVKNTFDSANTETNSAVVSQTKTPAAQQANAVCADPAKPCNHKEKIFDDWELPFKMPAKIQPNKPYKSAAFYAVILKTYEMGDDCDGGEYIEAVETERKELQTNHSERKVFAGFQCPNMAAVDYDFEGKWSEDKESVAIGIFLAIYAGTTKAEAENLLSKLKTEYPDAAIKQMTASYEKIEQ
jgi:hypothetical protein